MLSTWYSYPKIYSLGHRALNELLLDPCLVEEKIDGSQISFGRFSEYELNDGLRVRSKGAEINVLAPEKMFKTAVDIIKTLPLHDGWTYRAEYLAKPKHNALAYDRVPGGHLIIFDINTGIEEYLTWEEKRDEAIRLGLEVVPRIYQGMISNVEQFREWLNRESVLGGQQIEGLVCKNYTRFGPDKKILLGKFVSEKFKEVHKGEWRNSNPTNTDVIQKLAEELKTPARWNKAIQHLREAGKLENSPKDIGLLIQEIPQDIENECQDYIKDKLYKHHWPKIKRMVTAGFAQWYKDQLLESQFSEISV